ncbi:hypothetical protein SME38J_25670 [Serratia marcescens]|nr:hypothetical protein SME38J_25670 [Serratia marcescens]
MFYSPAPKPAFFFDFIIGISNDKKYPALYRVSHPMSLR